MMENERETRWRCRPQPAGSGYSSAQENGIVGGPDRPLGALFQR
jgi:hypothetical protein